MKREIRWIGFDMDECLGSVMPLYMILPKLRHRHDFLQMFELLYESEITGRTWLFRPAIFKALRLLWSAYDRGMVEGAFILSNNGSDILVKSVGLMMNYFIQRLINLDSLPNVFQIGIHLDAPCRILFGDVKSFELVQHVLAAHDLPPCTSPDHLLFFDDMPHVLQSQIAHYVRVPPYFNHTDVTILADVLAPLGEELEHWHSMVIDAVDAQKADFSRLENRYIMSPQSYDTTEDDEAMFRKAFHDFLGTAKPSRVNKKTLRGTKTRRTQRRMNRLAQALA